MLQPEGLMLDCYLPREDVRDAFVSLIDASIADLPLGAIVGSSQPAPSRAAGACGVPISNSSSFAATCRPGCKSWATGWRLRPSSRWRG